MPVDKKRLDDEIDGLDLDFTENESDESDDDGEDPIKKWNVNQYNAFGTCIVAKGKIDGKNIVSWDFTPKCDRDACSLGRSGSCTYTVKKDGSCTVVARMVSTYRMDFYEKYQDLDQGELNRVGFELMPLIVLQARMTIELSGGSLVEVGEKGGAKANPLLKEYHSVMVNISRIQTELDKKLEMKLKEMEGRGDRDGGDPLRGRR